MPLWEGVRPGTIQNTLLDWFFENIEGTTKELSLLIYEDDSQYYRNRVASALRALELKEKINNVPRGKWRLRALPIEIVDPAAQEKRICSLEAKVLTLEERIRKLCT